MQVRADRPITRRMGPPTRCFLGDGRGGLLIRCSTSRVFPPRAACSDVGCGTGSLACAMAARWPARNVVGIDIAAPYIAFARSQARFANLQFDLVDAIRLPYADAAFGGAAAQLVLNFVPDPIAVLHEIQRVTVPGRPLVAAVWDFRGGLVYQRIF